MSGLWVSLYSAFFLLIVGYQVVDNPPEGMPSMRDINEAHKVLTGEFGLTRALKTPTEKHPDGNTIKL